jgi:hypothetical protein
MAVSFTELVRQVAYNLNSKANTFGRDSAVTAVSALMIVGIGSMIGMFEDYKMGVGVMLGGGLSLVAGLMVNAAKVLYPAVAHARSDAIERLYDFE